MHSNGRQRRGVCSHLPQPAGTHRDDVLDDDFTLIKGTLNQAPLGDISLRAGDHTGE